MTIKYFWEMTEPTVDFNASPSTPKKHPTFSLRSPSSRSSSYAGGYGRAAGKSISSLCTDDPDQIVLLKVESHNFFVHKDLVAYSLFYDYLLSADGSCEIEVKGVDPKEFATFLYVLYDEVKEDLPAVRDKKHLKHDIMGNVSETITNRNVATLLRLSKKYDAPVVLDVCEQYLKDNPECPGRSELGQKFCLRRLNAHMLLDELLSQKGQGIDTTSKLAELFTNESDDDGLIAELLFRLEQERATLAEENLRLGEDVCLSGLDALGGFSPASEDAT